MRNHSRRNLLGRRVQDWHGQDIGHVVDTWPDDGGWEMQLVVIRLPRFGERRMIPVEQVLELGDHLWTAFTRRQIEDAPAVDGGRHAAEDPWRAKAYWMFEEPLGVGILTAPWRRSSGFSVTARPFPTNPSPTPTGS
jgi:hypothetical protein